MLCDSFNRSFRYLRLSVTDQCNFKCVYCLPEGYQKPSVCKPPLSVHEIQNLTASFSGLGIEKVRLTGGEPTIRPDIFEIIRAIRFSSDIKTVALTTNGYKLARMAEQLQQAGLSALNVSVDSLDREIFRSITGQDKLHEVLRGIDRALDAGIKTIKINAVLLKGLNHEAVSQFLSFVKIRPISVRFIELMETASNREFFARHHIAGETLRSGLFNDGWFPVKKDETAGPACEYAHPLFQGRAGIISPYSKDFCASCNRLRVTSQGALRLCLFGEGNHSIRHLLRASSQKYELMDYVRQTLRVKPASHRLNDRVFGDTTNLAGIGG